MTDGASLALHSDARAIEVRGAAENNLKNVDVDIPRKGLVVFTGVSGSGKSSLVFDTVGAEAQRQLNDTFTAFQRNRLPHYGRPDVASITNLSTPVIISQKRVGGNARSTVGTYTDTYALLRLLFSRVGQPYAGYSNAFSFNDPEGMCPNCEGIGTARTLDYSAFFDLEKSLNEGPFRHGPFGKDGWHIKVYTQSGRFDNDKKLKDYSKDEWHDLLYGSGRKVLIGSGAPARHAPFEGVASKFTRLYIRRDTSDLSDATKAGAAKFIVSGPCQACGGSRLNQRALECRIDGYNIADMAALECQELVKVLAQLSGSVASQLAGDVIERLKQLIDIGLGYLSLDRETGSLSGGESQRIKMVRHLGSSLVEVIYVLDEPSIGLHPRDVDRLTRMLKKLRDKGNTVLVVEHDPDVIAIADHVIDIGPGAGRDGGTVMFQGPVHDLLASDTPTGEALRTPFAIKAHVRSTKSSFPLRNATGHNLKNVDVDVPKGVLTVVTGVAGSGKSSLISGSFASAFPEAVLIDQSAIGVSSRSTPATYTGIMDPIRDEFAQATRSSASLFSFNSRGACPDCQGLGIAYTDLAFLDPIKTVCETCQGKRLKESVLRKRLRGKSISDVLEMPLSDARRFFDHPEITPTLDALIAVGLGYLSVGQPLSSLSGGELQRLKLAMKLGYGEGIYILDEPTTGLHMSDVGRLLKILDRLVDGGSTAIVIEHNLDVIANADWIIDMGPEAGRNGGKIVFQGQPIALAREAQTLTGRYLAAKANNLSAAMNIAR